ncbi:hypoxanthine phosphoribosyltransferase [Planoprotostelium fungivorum]|uniref:Hypoxanthine phosphoribosyltransferase n=1 Tax=Planoprotostelium fungivorum TaxID=1890364 RepID=A0A2P6N1M4_9EUKA|nr:hypoxanthine phosphoribosyltransferase [Planoprotostelium fungivorum]
MSRILYTKETIQKRIAELGAEITQHYKGEEVVIVGVLKGAFIFMADLVRACNFPCTMDFLAVSSYGNSTTSSGNVKIVMDGKHVLIVEDICDTGLTLSYLLELLRARKPKSLEVCVFLQKSACLKATDLKLKWVGFQAEPVFVVGYGLDRAEEFRNLDYVGELKQEYYVKK